MTETTVRQCPVCGRVVAGAFRKGPGGRPDAACPDCRSLERHRFLTLLLRSRAPEIARSRLILDIAPSPYTTRVLQDLRAPRVVRMDFDPGADGRLVDVQASLTQVPLADDSVDLLICYHVLEHVPDDGAAIDEIRRVLRPGGTGFVQVPWKPNVPTDEDPTVTDRAGRKARFGQADHVRWYGDDFEERLTSRGLDVVRVVPTDLVELDVCLMYHVLPNEWVWIVTPSAGPTGRLMTLEDTTRPSLADPRVADLERRYRRLRDLPPIRLAAALLNLARRVKRRLARAA